MLKPRVLGTLHDPIHGFHRHGPTPRNRMGHWPQCMGAVPIVQGRPATFRKTRLFVSNLFVSLNGSGTTFARNLSCPPPSVPWRLQELLQLRGVDQTFTRRGPHPQPVVQGLKAASPEATRRREGPIFGRKDGRIQGKMAECRGWTKMKRCLKQNRSCLGSNQNQGSVAKDKLERNSWDHSHNLLVVEHHVLHS